LRCCVCMVFGRHPNIVQALVVSFCRIQSFMHKQDTINEYYTIIWHVFLSIRRQWYEVPTAWLLSNNVARLVAPCGLVISSDVSKVSALFLIEKEGNWSC
jgi:hypothetical protein